MKPLVSIIIPVYNVEQYLEQCLDSVVNQTYSKIEAIVINDGSTDSSLDILKQYSEKYMNIKLIDKKNTGQGDTRNIGIDMASGEYIFFLDSDDYIKNDTIEVLINNITNDIDIIVYNGVPFNTEDNQILKTRYVDVDNNWTDRVFTGSEFFKEYMDYIQPCMKIYNRDFLIKNNIKYPNYKYGEDIKFWAECCIYAKKMKYVDYPSYFRRMGTGGVSTKVDYVRVEESIRSIKEICTLVERQPEQFKKFSAVYSYRCLGRAFRLKSRKERRALIKIFKERNCDKVIYNFYNNKRREIITKLVCLNII